MLFITNRVPHARHNSHNGDSYPRAFRFDLSRNAPTNAVFFCERTAKGDYQEVGHQALFKRLKTCNYRQILLFVHGYSQSPEEAFADAASLQRLCDQMSQSSNTDENSSTNVGKTSGNSTPQNNTSPSEPLNEVLVVPIIWPCDNDIGRIRDYWDDEQAADMSAFSLRRLCQHFVAWQNSQDNAPPCLKRINILTHSMGARVLRATLEAWRHYDLPQGVPLLFRNVFLIAADVVNETLERGQKGEAISHAAGNVCVYYAADDLALRASKVVNLKNGIVSRRLGHTGPENWANTPNNVYAFDCDAINTAYDYPIGHSYFLSPAGSTAPGVVFKQIFSTIKTGRPNPRHPNRHHITIE